MNLRDLEKILRGNGVAVIQWKDKYNILKEISTHIHFIGHCDDSLLVREVLRLEIKGNDIEIFLK